MSDAADHRAFYRTYVDAYRPGEASPGRPASPEYLRETFGVEGRVLDLCCGAGLHTFALREAGVEAVGVDVEPALLAEARAYADEQSVPAPVVRGDARELAVADGAFDWALLVRSLPFFDPEGLAALAGEVARVLAPDGRLLLSYRDLVGSLVDGYYERVLANPTETHDVFAFHRGYEPTTGRVERVFLNFDTGETFDIGLHVWAPWLVEFVLERAGFERRRLDHPGPHSVVEVYARES